MDIITRNEAISIEQKWYFTGVPCKEGHIAKRLVEGYSCYECAKSHSKNFRDKNPKYHHQYNKEYYPENKERTKELSDRYYARIKEENYKEHKERHDRNHKKYRSTHQEEVRQREHKYRANNPGAVNATTAKRRAQKLNATPIWADLKEIKEIYKECQRINILHKKNGGTDMFVVDHIIPLQGNNVTGLHVANNLRIITASENSTKSNKIIEELLGENNVR